MIRDTGLATRNLSAAPPAFPAAFVAAFPAAPAAFFAAAPAAAEAALDARFDLFCFCHKFPGVDLRFSADATPPPFLWFYEKRRVLETNPSDSMLLICLLVAASVSYN